MDVHLKQLISAPRYRVFRAWTDPDEIAQWWPPPDSANTRIEMDLTLNGVVRYRATTAGRHFEAEGNFTEVDGPLRLVMAWRFYIVLMDRWEGVMPPNEKETTVSVEFRDRGSSTEIELSHTGLTDPAAIAEMEERWGSSLSRLADAVAA
jgi:uncharacterized protein YndB with AHSA1/START domain